MGNCSCELYPVWCCCCPRQVPPITHGKVPRVEIGNCPCGGKPVFLSFFLSMEGSIQTSLFSWLRFPQNFLRLCHSHVFGGSNPGDVCYKGRKNTQFEAHFFLWRQLDVVEFAFWFLLVGDLSTTSCFFFSFHTMEVLDTNKKSLR